MLKVSEVYSSVQGEGAFTGVPTTFVRFGGCNMRCPGWPCDTLFAVDPKFHKDWTKIGSSQLLASVPPWPRRVCLTGGEPFIQPLDELEDFVAGLIHNGYGVECFSNGTVHYPAWALHWIHFTMDWKLAGSGESQTHRAERVNNALRLRETDGLKFVCKDAHDLQEAYELLMFGSELNKVKAEIWVGSAWDGTERAATLTDADIVDFLMQKQLDWKLNLQTHKFIWQPDERRV